MKIAEIEVSYNNPNTSKVKVQSSRVSYNLFLSVWNKSTIQLQEEFKVMLLDRSNQALGIYPLSKGGVSATLVDPKLVFSVALKCNASAIILAHNHPSSNLSPSESDKKLTDKLKQAGKLLDILVLDHIILTKTGYTSFADECLL